MGFSQSSSRASGFSGSACISCRAQEMAERKWSSLQADASSARSRAGRGAGRSGPSGRPAARGPLPVPPRRPAGCRRRDWSASSSFASAAMSRWRMPCLRVSGQPAFEHLGEAAQLLLDASPSCGPGPRGCGPPCGRCRRSSGSRPRRWAGACGRCGRSAAPAGWGSTARRSGTGSSSGSAGSGPRGRRRWRCRMRTGCFRGRR